MANLPPAAMPMPNATVPMPLVPPPPQAGAAAIGANASLYVGDLGDDVTEEQLYAHFISKEVKNIASVRICRDQTLGTSLGYGYVNFHSHEDAKSARDAVNLSKIDDKFIRVMFSNKDPSNRNSGRANVFIRNLNPNINSEALYSVFVHYGPVLSCKVACDFSGNSKGYGFVQFEEQSAADNAIEELNGMCFNDRPVYMSLFVSRQARNRANGAVNFTNVYVKNLPQEFSDDDLTAEFGPFGTITSSVVMKDANGNSRCFGFVNFETPEAAAAAVENVNGRTIGDKVLFVGRAQKKSEREVELKSRFQQEKIARIERLRGLNLFLKNLDEAIDDEGLRALFSEYGEILSCKVLRDAHGRSKGSGFVAFTTTEAARLAISGMNGKMTGRKPLYVAFAQRKEERRKMLMAHYAQIHNQKVINAAMAAMPMYHAPVPAPNMMGGPPPPPLPMHPAPHRMAHPPPYFGPGAPGPLPPPPPGVGFHPQFPIPPGYVMPYMPMPYPPPHMMMGHYLGGPPPQQFMMMGHPPGGPPPQQFAMMGHPPGGPPPQQFMMMGHPPGGPPPQQFVMMGHPPGGPPPQQFVMMGHPPGGPPQQQLVNGNNNQGYVPNGYDGADPSQQPQGPSNPPVPLSTTLAAANPAQQRLILGDQLHPLVKALVEPVEPGHTAKVTGMLLEMCTTDVLHLMESPDALRNRVAECVELVRRKRAQPSVDVAPPGPSKN